MPRIVQKSIWLVINRLIGLKLRQIIMLLMTLTIQIRQWGFIIPMSDFKYASEVVSIDQAYPAFKEWSASSGTSQKNWYMNPEEICLS